jgi:hypothetical protein
MGVAFLKPDGRMVQSCWDFALIELGGGWLSARLGEISPPQGSGAGNLAHKLRPVFCGSHVWD